jgi:hypothetical protein
MLTSFLFQSMKKAPIARRFALVIMPFTVFADYSPVWVLLVFLRQMLFLKVPIGNVTVFDAVISSNLCAIDKWTGHMRRWAIIYRVIIFHNRCFIL